ncbi:MAG TPA: hypothetical protein VF892_20705, partial [Pseudonocardiaceae bacterium]
MHGVELSDPIGKATYPSVRPVRFVQRHACGGHPCWHTGQQLTDVPHGIVRRPFAPDDDGQSDLVGTLLLSFGDQGAQFAGLVPCCAGSLAERG